MSEKKIHIGKLVEDAFNQKPITKKAFANAIGIQSQNIKRHFESEDWSVIKLISAGKVLNHDFSYLFNPNTKKEKPKILFQIEVTEDNKNDVIKIINGNELCKM